MITAPDLSQRIFAFNVLSSLSMVLRSAFPRYSTVAGAGLVSRKSVFASIKPAMAAPTAPRPSDHIPMASVSPSRMDDTFVLLKEDWLFWLSLEKCRFVEIARMHIVLTEVGKTNVLNGDRHVEMVSGRYFEGRLCVTTILLMARCRGDWDTETLYLTLQFTLREILPLGDK